MSNTFATINAVTREFARVLGNQTDLAKRVNRDQDDQFGVKSAQIGETIRVRRPSKPTLRSGSAVSTQDIVETTSSLTFGVPFGSDYQVTSQALTFSVEDYNKKVTEPTANLIASQIEAQGQALITSVYNMVGTPGTALVAGASGTALPMIARALALMNKNGAHGGADRQTLLNDPDFNAVLATSNLSYFNPGPEISKMYTSGYQGDFSSFRVFMNQLVLPHTNGTYGGTPRVNGAVAANSIWSETGTLVTDGWTPTTTALNVGDIFTIAGVYMVNPVTKTTLGTLQQFSVQTLSVTDGSGNSTLVIAPAIVTAGGFQNVSAAPADNALISVTGASTVVTQNALAFDRDAFMLAAKALEMPSVGIASVITDDQTNIPVRVWQAADISSGTEIMRFDAMVAWAPLYPQLACRIATT